MSAHISSLVKDGLILSLLMLELNPGAFGCSYLFSADGLPLPDTGHKQVIKPGAFGCSYLFSADGLYIKISKHLQQQSYFQSYSHVLYKLVIVECIANDAQNHTLNDVFADIFRNGRKLRKLHDIYAQPMHVLRPELGRVNSRSAMHKSACVWWRRGGGGAH